MSKFTTQLRWIVEQSLKDQKLPNEESEWPKVYRKLGLHDYPIFDESYRSTLNDKIIRRYYFREIGQETAGQFAWFMRRTMHEIMPYYNQLYESQLYTIDPVNDIDMRYSENWQSDNLTDSDSNNRNVFQDTPMSLLDNTSAPTIEGLDYATNVSYDKSHSTTDSAGNGTRDKTEKGHRQNQAELLMKYRDTFLNIDKDIVDSLGGLFIGLW